MPLNVSCTTVVIHPRRPFTIARGTVTEYTSVILQLEQDGLIGFGEARPIPRYNDSHPEVLRRLESAVPQLGGLPVSAGSAAWYPFLNDLFPDSAATRSAVDMALWDLHGKLEGAPVGRLLGAPEITVPSSYTVTMENPDGLREQLAGLAGYPILKIKLGGPWDADVLALLANYPDHTYCFDANEGWSVERALQLVPLMAQLKIDLIEQPFPAGNFEDVGQLRQTTAIPIIADEDCVGPGNLAALAGAYDGVNIKLVKCGGITVARQMIEEARSLGLQIMLGCMVESSLGVTAMAQLAGWADYLDLDGAALLADDPFTGLDYEQGAISLPDGAGIGAEPDPERW